MSSEKIWDKYLSLEYCPDNKHGINCWGLCRLILAQECGIEIDDPTVSARQHMMVARKIANNIGKWVPIKRGEEQTFDCILMPTMVMSRQKRYLCPVHIALVTEPGKFIQAEPYTNVSIIDYYRNSMFRERNMGFYRHAALPVKVAIN